MRASPPRGDTAVAGIIVSTAATDERVAHETRRRRSKAELLITIRLSDVGSGWPGRRASLQGRTMPGDDER